jgi:hypothetical protein
VANYVPRPRLRRKIEEELRDGREDGASKTRTLVVCGLEGSGKCSWCRTIREYRHDYSAVFWIEAGKKESIERDYIQIHRLLFGYMATGAESVKLQDAVPAVKN